MSGKYDDAAVSRLVEAANAYRETVRPYEGVNDLARQAWWKFSQVIDAIPAPASPAPEKGVRCWRHMCYKGNPDPNSYDRIRRYGDGEYELVYRDGRTEKAHGTDYANSSAYVECPDSPYVATPVAAPSPEPAAMGSAEAFVIRLNYTQGSADKAKMVESRDAAWQARLDAANAQLAGDKAELLAALSNRDAEIARLTKQRDDAEREINESARARTGEESRLSAAGGVDRENMENLKHEAWIMGYKRGQVDAKAGRNIAALTTPGEVGNG